ncbi:coiled-coil domain-containing protein 157 isoform X2 [Kryptolebias marmoratus]|uniref:coiled-coil domain-containing protein 157 isoform X2 n=1 Tax=Kryptolebias marmoratus TaxID=37003 RepID=UPI0018ACF6C5|nr:coiled-coil domain-containing protein 157 isoform X2 [Kryptolebias marmoratus]
MSQLLGRRDCIKSLRKDLVDIQGAILDVFSRTGPVCLTSWKFPDKLSCNLDMVALLEEYDFEDGEETFNQHSHIVLLELVIDRLLLLLQSVSAYSEQQRGRHRREQTQQKGCLSVGLVVRNYWCNLLKFTNKTEILTDMTKQEKSKTESPVSSKSSSRTDLCKHCTSAWSSTTSFTRLPQNNAPSSPRHNITCYPKAEQRHVSCQTTESSLIPCDACHQVQSLLRHTGVALMDLFRSEGLPSSLQPLSAAMEDAVDVGHMMVGDVAQWADEQLRDMRRLAKHLQDVRGTVQPLKGRLDVAETERDRLRSQLDRAQKEFKQKLEKLQTNIVQLEFSLQKAQRSSKETEQRLQDEQQQLKKENLSLEESNNQLKEKVALQQDALQELETEKTELHKKVKNLQAEKETFCRLQQSVQQLQTQLSDTQVLLDKEKAKYLSACRQQESMQAKQKSLLGRVNVLDEECEELQRQLGEKEEAQISLHSQLQQMSEVKEQQQAQLIQQQNLCEKLQREKQTTETRVDELKKHVSELMDRVQALRERERQLVAFPELSNWARAQPQSTGNVILDMEQQLQVNSIRIKVLEQENTTLRKSLEKLRQRAQRHAPREASSQKT